MIQGKENLSYEWRYAGIVFFIAFLPKINSRGKWGCAPVVSGTMGAALQFLMPTILKTAFRTEP
ncbi:hypothetical protein A4R26_19375 [Niastella populi]|uniref:Uncharacterized protein n=1 Tax=Niastella populi TaxID=550983 RepID=A0A1V9FQV1_9BACT|nr:hypothetical protein A4R26_19375 [Niastella populi]